MASGSATKKRSASWRKSIAIALSAVLGAALLVLGVPRTIAAWETLAAHPALEKLEVASQQNPLPASPATAHLFIVNPLTSGGLASLFSTHPPIEERIARLQAMKL